MKTLQPAGWALPRGYANGVVAEGESIFLAGQIGDRRIGRGRCTRRGSLPTPRLGPTAGPSEALREIVWARRAAADAWCGSRSRTEDTESTEEA